MARSAIIDVPLLARGTHRHPRHGGCLLELVSIIPEGAWTDRPTRLDPTLGSLARAVNDASADADRPALAPLIPWLATAPNVDPDLAANRLHQLVADLLSSHDRPPTRQQDWSTAGTDRRVGSMLRNRRQRRAAERAMQTAVRTLNSSTTNPGATAHALRDLLIAGLDEIRAVAGLPPAQIPDRPAHACRASVAVQVRLADTAEATHLHGRACLDRWPTWLLTTPLITENSREASGTTTRALIGTGSTP